MSNSNNITNARIDYDREEVLITLNDKFGEFILTGYDDKDQKRTIHFQSVGVETQYTEVNEDNLLRYAISLIDLLQLKQLSKLNIKAVDKTEEQRRWEIQHYDEIQRKYLKEQKERKQLRAKDTREKKRATSQS